MRSRNQGGLSIIHVIGILVFGGIAALFIFGETDNQKRERLTAAETRPERSESKFITGPDYFGCIEKDRHSTLISMLVQKDEKAFAKSLARALNSNSCVRFKQGSRVFLQDVELTSGLIRLRVEGDETSYWALREVIK